MSQPLLSILIPYTLDRSYDYDRLYNRLVSLGVNTGKYKGIVREISDCDGKETPIGLKRERMYAYAEGLYSWQIDCDDDIADDAIEQILDAIKSNPQIPCITFRENCMMNGEYKSSNHSIKYEKWEDNFDGFDYVRCAFYKDVIRTDIAKSVPFPHIRYNEDEQWSMAIKPLLTDEIHIDKELYFYIYEPKDTHEERYGFNK